MPIQTVVPSKRLVLNGQTLTPTTTTKKQCISLIILRKNRNRRKEQKMYQNNHWRLLKRQQLTIAFLWKLSKLRRRNVTSFQMQFEKWGRGFPPPCFQPTVQSPSLGKASCRNTHPHFQKCMQKNMTSERRCSLLSFRKKANVAY